MLQATTMNRFTYYDHLSGFWKTKTKNKTKSNQNKMKQTHKKKKKKHQNLY